MILLLVSALAFLQSATFSSLSMPFSLLNPALMATVTLALTFRFRLAVLSAAAAGLISDIITPSPAASGTLAGAIILSLVSLSVAKFVSHRTTVAVVGTNALAFIGMHLLTSVVGSAVRVMTGDGPLFHPAAATAALGVCLALPVQCLAVLAFRWSANWTYGRFRRLVLVTRPDRL